MFFMVPVKFDFANARLETPENPGVIVDESARTLTTRVALAPEALIDAVTKSDGHAVAAAGLKIDAPHATATADGENAIRIALKGAR